MKKIQFILLISLAVVHSGGWAQDAPYKKAEVSNKIEIVGDIDFAWTYVSDLGNLQYLVPSSIKKSERTGNGRGSIVTLTLVNKNTIVEEVLKMDNKKRHISYTMISTPLPIKKYKASFRVNPISDDRFEVIFHARFKVQEPNRKSRIEAFNALQIELLENLKSKTHENR